MVLIHATVLDRAGRTVRGLTREHFRLLDDRRERAIDYFSEEELPLSLAVVFDTSGSMASRMAGARRAVNVTLDHANPLDEFCLITFADRPELRMPWVRDAAAIRDGIRFAPARGATSLLDAIRLALGEMKRSSNPRRALMVFSDGGDNHSRNTERQIARLLEESDAQMYAVDMAEDAGMHGRSPEELAGPGLLERLCERAGGRYFQARSARELAAVGERISRGLRSVYVLGYVPAADAGDGRFHRVQLKVRSDEGRNLSVYCRSGYRAQSE